MKNYFKKLGNIWPKINVQFVKFDTEKDSLSRTWRCEKVRFYKIFRKNLILFQENLKRSILLPYKKWFEDEWEKMKLIFALLIKEYLFNFEAYKKMKWSIDFREMTS